MEKNKFIIIFLVLVFAGVAIFIGYDYFFNKEKGNLNGNDQAIGVAQLLEMGVDGQEKQVYGEIAWITPLPKISSEGRSVQLMIEEGATIAQGTEEGNNIWVIATGILTKEEKLAVSKIALLESDIHDEINYFDEEAKNDGLIIAGSSVCKTDADCVHFGKTGECNCGCYNKDGLPSSSGGACFCQAPTSCACIESKCEGVFE